MKATIQSTTKLVQVNGVPARVWEGVSERGIRFHAYITRVAVNRGDDAQEFQMELQECQEPTEDVAAIPKAIQL